MAQKQWYKYSLLFDEEGLFVEFSFGPWCAVPPCRAPLLFYMKYELLSECLAQLGLITAIQKRMYLETNET